MLNGKCWIICANSSLIQYFQNFDLLFFEAPGPVESFNLLPFSSSQLRLTWQAPGDPNGNIIGYKVTWKIVSDDKLQSVNGNRTEMTLSKDNTSYMINYLGKRCKLKVKKLSYKVFHIMDSQKLSTCKSFYSTILFFFSTLLGVQCYCNCYNNGWGRSTC